MRAVCAWELGAGLGHVARLGAFGKALAARGMEVTHALRDLHAVAEAGDWLQGRSLQAPWLARTLSGRDRVPPSHAGVLLEAGYASAETLTALVEAWRGLLEGQRTDVVVADHAPTAALAARLMGIPVVQFGDGFTVPPAGGDYFGDSMRRDLERVEQAAGQALASVNAVLADAGLTSLARVEDIWLADRTILATYPELDHHRGMQRLSGYEGRLESDGQDSDAWEAPGLPRVFAYLKPEGRLFQRALEVLHGARLDVRGYAGGMQPRLDTRGRVRWSPRPLAAAAIAGCDLVVGTGGHGLSCAALLAGKPLLLLPEFSEQWITARNVESMGAGLWVHPDADPRQLARSLRRLVDEPAFTRRAREFAERYGEQRARSTVRLAELAEKVRDLASADRGAYAS